MAIATGQFTIIDYNDALSLTGYISSNVVKTQMYNPDTGGYNPDWTASPYLVLTPSLFILGTSSDIITNAAVQSVTWYDVTGASEAAIVANTSHVLSGTKSHVLTIKTNEAAGLPGKDYMCKIIYRDSSTNLDLTYKMNISFSRVVNGGGIADAIAWCPNGNVFKNGTVSTITAVCDLWRGSVTDATSVTYRWYKQDSNVFVPTTLAVAAAAAATSATLTSVTGINVGESIKIGTANAVTLTGVNTSTKVVTWTGGLSAAQAIGVAVQHANYDTDAGSGWRYINSDIANSITGVATNTITIYNSYVLNYAVFMCIIKDTDTGSNTYNNLFKDTVTVMDQSDPIQVSITSTGGDVFKNSVGTTTLTAKVYQNGTEIDSAGTKYTYTWSIYDKDGNASTFNGGAASKTGKTLAVGDADVSVKATFQVIIS